MEAGPLVLAAMLVLPLLAGLGVLRAMRIDGRDDALALLGWAWAAGALATGVVLLAWLALGLPLVPWGPSVLVWLLAAWMLKRRPRGAGAPPAPTPATSAPAPERALLGAVVVLALALCGLRMLDALSTLVALPDEATIWAGRAKALWHAGALDAGYGELARRGAPLFHADYPLLDTLLQTWTFVLADGVLHAENRLPVQLCMVALVLVAAAALRQQVRPAVAAALLAALVLTEPVRELTRFAYADHMVALGLLVAVDGWLRWLREGRARFWRLAMLGLALAVASKNEGLLIGMAFGAGILVAAAARVPLPRPGRALGWVAAPVAAALVHAAVNLAFGFRNDLLATHASGTVWELLPARLLERGGLVAARFLEYGALDVRHAGGLLAGWALVTLAHPRRALRACGVAPALALALALTGLALVYAGTPWDVDWHVGLSLSRVLFQLVPAAAVLLAAALAAIFPRLAAGRAQGASRSPSNVV